MMGRISNKDMANILLTEKCNLRCKYCFATDYTDRHTKEISFENLKRMIQFIVKDNGKAKIGLIGGEPTLYSHFAETLDYLEESSIEHAVIFTNGIELEKYKDHIVSDKLVFLINCNSPEDIGNSNYQKMMSTIECLVQEKGLRNNILLGLNIYKQHMDIAYFCDLLKKFHFLYARISVVVPSDIDAYENAYEYFLQMKPTLLQIFESLAEVGVLPKYDCNKVPKCVWTKEEQEYIRELFGKRLNYSNLLNDTVNCKPTLDIDTDLNVIRCFGFSDDIRVRVDDFLNMEAIHNFFINEIDSRYIETNQSEEKCKSCYGGCLAFKKK